MYLFGCHGKLVTNFYNLCPFFQYYVHGFSRQVQAKKKLPTFPVKVFSNIWPIMKLYDISFHSRPFSVILSNILENYQQLKWAPSQNVALTLMNIILAKKSQFFWQPSRISAVISQCALPWILCVIHHRKAYFTGFHVIYYIIYYLIGIYDKSLSFWNKAKNCHIWAFNPSLYGNFGLWPQRL